MSDYEIVIGLEVHAELNTKTKVFCGCKNGFGDKPNANTCPVCVGLPGALPILNKAAVEKTIVAGLTIGSQISPVAVFERKNYFYPDLSKAYQISQLVKPICVGGKITLDSGKEIRINRIHLEEDAGKLVHRDSESFIDYNRGGVPLIETVTEPDLSSAEEAGEFLEKLRNNFVYAGIAECRMERGEMRCDVNVSVRPKGSTKFGTRTEMKNLNSFRSVKRAIAYEAARQIEEIENGNTIKQETRKWDDERGKSYPMRSKEESQDYRYFPDPDILGVEIKQEVVDALRKTLPLLPSERKELYVSTYGLPEYDANILLSEKFISDYFDAVNKVVDKPKQVSNWIMVNVLKTFKEKFCETLDEVISSDNLAQVILMVENKEITRANGITLYEKLCEEGGDARKLAKDLGYFSAGLSDEELVKIIDGIFEANPSAKGDYASNPDKVVNFFMGQLMKATKGAAKVEKARPIIIQKLEG